jgi:hypothetical protein
VIKSWQMLKPQASKLITITTFQYVFIQINRRIRLRKKTKKDSLTAKIVTQDSTTKEYTIFWYQIRSSISCGPDGVVSGEKFNPSSRYITGKNLCNNPVAALRHAHANRRNPSSRKSLRC